MLKLKNVANARETLSTINGVIKSTKDTYLKKMTKVNVRCEPVDWVANGDLKPFKYQCSKSIELPANAVVELVNDQPILFTTYGIVIGEILGGVVLYAITKPNEAVVLSLLIAEEAIWQSS